MWYIYKWNIQFSLVAQLCPTLCNPMNRSMPDLPVHHQLPEFTQTHVHRVGGTSPKHPASCIEPGLATRFPHDTLHVSLPFSQIFPPSPSPTESIRPFYTSVSLLLSRTPGYCYHLSKFHIYALVYCIYVFPSSWLSLSF